VGAGRGPRQARRGVARCRGAPASGPGRGRGRRGKRAGGRRCRSPGTTALAVRLPGRMDRPAGGACRRRRGHSSSALAGRGVLGRPPRPRPTGAGRSRTPGRPGRPRIGVAASAYANQSRAPDARAAYGRCRPRRVSRLSKEPQANFDVGLEGSMRRLSILYGATRSPRPSPPTGGGSARLRWGRRASAARRPEGPTRPPGPAATRTSRSMQSPPQDESQKRPEGFRHGSRDVRPGSS
jgi:hypothetical protein